MATGVHRQQGIYAYDIQANSIYLMFHVKHMRRLGHVGHMLVLNQVQYTKKPVRVSQLTLAIL